VSVANQAAWYEQAELEDEAPAVLPEELEALAPVRQAPAGLLDRAWLVLAALGVALAAAAAIWFVHLRPAPPATLSVPRVVGLDEARAVSALTSEGFRVRAVEESSSSGRQVVTSQLPLAQTRLHRGATVTIHVAGRPNRSIASRLAH
jgi:hypothetical protein